MIPASSRKQFLEIPVKTSGNRPFPQSPTTLRIDLSNGIDISDQIPVISPRIKDNKKTSKLVSSSMEKLEHNDKKPQFNEFLSKVERFQRAKNEKLTNLKLLKKEREELDLKNIPKVKMSEQSKKILQNKQKKLGVSSEIALISNFSISPQTKSVNTSHAIKIQPSTTRNVTTKTLFSNLTEPSNSKATQSEIQSTLASDKVLASKFVKEFNQALLNLTDGKFSMNADETKLLLLELKFISYHENSSKNDAQIKLFHKLWEICVEQDTQEITIENFRIFLLATQNIFLPSMGHSQLKSQLGSFIDGKLHFTQEEVHKIHKIFHLFYSNRKNSIAELNEQKKIGKLQEIKSETKSIRERNKEQNEDIKISGNPKKIDITLKDLHLRSASTKSMSKSILSPDLISDNQRENTCRTPRIKRIKNNTSFRSSRNTSRSQSRLAYKNSRKSSISTDMDTKFILPGGIQDPSLLSKAQDLLGQFIAKSKEEIKKNKTPRRPTKKIVIEPEKIICDEQAKDNSIIGKSESSKLIFKKKSRLKSLNSKNINQDLQKVTEILKKGQLPIAKYSEDKRGLITK